MKKTRMVTSFIAILILFVGVICLPAYADTNVIVQPGPDDIQEGEAKEIAAEFYAQKCGTMKEVLLTSEWECYFGNVSESLLGLTDTHWTLVIHHSPEDPDPWPHLIVLSRKGELIYWEAHDNMGYKVAEPDLLDGAIYAEPLSTDAQEKDIIQATREALIKAGAYSAKTIDTLSLQAHFIYEEHFNQGKIPGWLVYASREGNIEWKALFGYNGYAISIVPYQQDFKSYLLPSENFWDHAFGEGSEEKYLLAGITDGSMPLEERVVVTDRWRPYVERWMKEHPYYLNAPGIEYDITIRNRYGVPDEKALSQDEAIHLAREEAVRQGCSQSTIDTRKAIVYYYVTDPAHPVWEIFLGRIQDKTMSAEERTSDVTNISTCTVKLDAYSGKVVDSFLKKPFMRDATGNIVQRP